MRTIEVTSFPGREELPYLYIIECLRLGATKIGWSINTGGRIGAACGHGYIDRALFIRTARAMDWEDKAKMELRGYAAFETTVECSKAMCRAFPYRQGMSPTCMHELVTLEWFLCPPERIVKAVERAAGRELQWKLYRDPIDVWMKELEEV